MVGEILSELAFDIRSVEQASRAFFANSVMDITKFVRPQIIERVADEADKLVARFSHRRDMKIPSTAHTPRRMDNVGHATIRAQSPFLVDVYRDGSLLGLLSNILGEEVQLCPYDPEKMVITCLSKKGDSHGWHWDDYSLALVWVLEAPQPESGGVLQCVPNTKWNRTNPKIIEQFLVKPITTYHFPSRSVYLMRSNTTLHRVYPLHGENARRVVLNSTYALQEDLGRQIDHSSMEQLFALAQA